MDRSTSLTELITQLVTGITGSPTTVLGDPRGEPSFAYVRVSSSGQAEEGRSGLPRQLAHIHERAQETHLAVPASLVYSDDHSGFEFETRPGLQRLLAEIRQPRRPAHHLVIEYLDRLSRNARWHQGYLLDLFASQNVQVHFWRAFNSEIERAVMGAISEQGMRQEIERMVQGTRHKAETGRITSKRPAYGYQFVDSEGRPATDPSSDFRKNTHYAIQPDEAAIMREVYERIGLRGESLYEVVEDLIKRQVPPAKGARNWFTSHMSKLLYNPVYKGEFVANRYYTQKEWSERAQRMVLRQRQRPKYEWIIVPVPAIVTPDLWEATHDALRRNYRHSSRNAQVECLLLGFLRCARCGSAFTGGAMTGPHVDGKKTKGGYICRTWSLPPTLRESVCCRSPYIRAENIDHHVWDAVCQIITDPDLVTSYLQEKVQDDASSGPSDHLAYVDRQIAACEREDHQWDRAFAGEILTLDEYKAKKGNVRQRLEMLVGERAALQQKVEDAREIERKQEIVRQQLERIRAGGFARDMPFKAKRRLMSMLIDRVVIDTADKWFRLEGVIKGTYNYGDARPFESISGL